MNHETQQKIEEAPRADSLQVASGGEIHDRWALHSFALEQGNDWLPTNLRCYHEGRILNGELMEGYYDEFIPQTYDAPRGRILKKEVDENTTVCPDCDVAARKYDNDTFCPECGLLALEEQASDDLVRDEKAAGRVMAD